MVVQVQGHARRLGMTDSHYTDPSGLSASTTSTAADQVRRLRQAEPLQQLTGAAAGVLAGQLHPGHCARSRLGSACAVGTWATRQVIGRHRNPVICQTAGVRTIPVLELTRAHTPE